MSGWLARWSKQSLRQLSEWQLLERWAEKQRGQTPIRVGSGQPSGYHV
jgi:hypothetical protein